MRKLQAKKKYLSKIQIINSTHLQLQFTIPGIALTGKHRIDINMDKRNYIITVQYLSL